MKRVSPWYTYAAAVCTTSRRFPANTQHRLRSCVTAGLNVGPQLRSIRSVVSARLQSDVCGDSARGSHETSPYDVKLTQLLARYLIDLPPGGDKCRARHPWGLPTHHFYPPALTVHCAACCRSGGWRVPLQIDRPGEVKQGSVGSFLGAWRLDALGVRDLMPRVDRQGRRCEGVSCLIVISFHLFSKACTI